jgi:hypothetical protein
VNGLETAQLAHAHAAPTAADPAAASDRRSGRAAAPARRRWLGAALGISVLLALLALFFSTPLRRWSSASYTAADLTQDYTLTQFERGHDPGNRLLGDPVVEMQPWMLFNRDELGAGHLPLWNDANGSGVPHLANYQSAIFSPYSLPFYLLSFKAALLAAAFLKLFGLALFTFLFLRLLGAGVISACIGSAVFTFSGHNVLLLAYPHAAAVIALPAGLYFSELALQRFERRRSSAPALAALTLVFAAGLLSGQPEPFYFSALMVALYILLRLVPLAWRRWLDTGEIAGSLRLAAGFALCPLIATGACAMQLLPFFEYLSKSTVIELRSNLQTPLIRITWPLHFFPNLLGNPSLPYHIGYNLPPPNFEAANTSYAGATAWLLLLLAPFFARRNLRLAFFAFLAAGWVCYAYNLLGLSHTIARFPTLSLAPINRSQPFGLFAIAACSALVMDQLLHKRRERAWRASVVTLLLGGGLFFVFWLGAQDKLDLVSRYRIFQKGFDELAREHLAYIGTWYAVGLAAVAGLFVVKPGWIQGLLASLVLAAVFAQSGWLLRDYNPTVEDRFVFARTPAIEKLRKYVGREPLVILDPVQFPIDTIPPHTNLAYGLKFLTNYDGMWVKRYDELYHTVFGNGGNWRNAVRASERGLRLFGAGLVLSPGQWVRVDTANTEVQINPKDLYTIGEILPETPAVQTFFCSRDRLQGVALFFSTYGRRSNCTLRVQIHDLASGVDIAEKVLATDDWEDDRFARHEVLLPFDAVPDSRGRSYRITVSSSDSRAGHGVTLWARRDLWYWEHWVAIREPTRSPFATIAPRTAGDFHKPNSELRRGGKRLSGGLLLDQTDNLDRFQALRSIGGSTLARVRDALPRYWSVSRAIGVRSDLECFKLVAQSNLDPASVVVLSQAAGDVKVTPIDRPSAGSPDAPPAEPAVQVLEETSGHLRLKLERSQPGYVVLAQTFYPGWTAKVNGAAAPVLRANYTFCAVEVGSGASEVELRFESGSFRRGAWIALASALAGLTVAAISWLRGSAPRVAG